ncbi:MAG: YybH family protein [Flavisolibacter sp.]
MKSFLLLLLLISQFCFAQSSSNKDEQHIRAALDVQTTSWNGGDIEGFMQTYWKSDSLLFIGKSGIRLGWKETLNNYKKSYPDSAAMGKLSFDILQVRRLSPEYYFVVGKWTLTRTVGNLSGYYDLIFRKIAGKWLIISDHSS